MTDVSTRVDLGRGVRRVEIGRVSWLLRRRTAIVAATLVTVIVAAGAVSLTIGDYPMSLGDVFGALAGTGSDTDVNQVVLEWRLPHLLFAILCGAALGLSGGIFQSLTRNPLGSPDVIGFGTGSYLGVTVAITLLGVDTYLGKASAALLGGFATAAIVYLLAYRVGFSSFRLIIVGIGVAAGLGALTSWVLITVSIEKAMMATTWGAGTLASLGYDQLVPATAVFLVLLLISLPLQRSLPVLEMGDDAASAIGASPNRIRLVAMIAGVGLIALVTAAAGPISFIALAAPQIAQRLVRSNSPMAPLSVMLTGAALVVVADCVALTLRTPVGVVTLSVGGIYLAWLLARQYRRRA